MGRKSMQPHRTVIYTLLEMNAIDPIEVAQFEVDDDLEWMMAENRLATVLENMGIEWRIERKKRVPNHCLLFIKFHGVDNIHVLCWG